MIKIGIAAVTYKDNFGSALQTYATQYTLEKLGYDARIFEIKGVHRGIMMKKMLYYAGRLFDPVEAKYLFANLTSRSRKSASVSSDQFAQDMKVRHQMYQDFIDKDFEYQLIGCSTKSEVIIPGVSKILRPCKGSNTSYLHYTPLEENFCEIEKCKEFIRQTGYHGLFSIEFLRDKNGKDYFMEINFRNDGNAICVTTAGMSLPYIWYLDCIGADYSDERNKKIDSVYVMPDMAELKLLVTRQISLKDYISDFQKTNRFMEYDKRDKKPFWKLVQFHICKRLSI